jgi:hypothetical protein
MKRDWRLAFVPKKSAKGEMARDREVFRVGLEGTLAHFLSVNGAARHMTHFALWLCSRSDPGFALPGTEDGHQPAVLARLCRLSGFLESIAKKPGGISEHFAIFGRITC